MLHRVFSFLLKKLQRDEVSPSDDSWSYILVVNVSECSGAIYMHIVIFSWVNPVHLTVEVYVFMFITGPFLIFRLSL